MSALEKCLNVFDKIVGDVEKEIDHRFTPDEVSHVLSHTIRKCQVNGKGNSYVPILFKDELKDYVGRMVFNLTNEIMCAKQNAPMEV